MHKVLPVGLEPGPRGGRRGKTPLHQPDLTELEVSSWQSVKLRKNQKPEVRILLIFGRVSGVFKKGLKKQSLGKMPQAMSELG